MTKADGTGTDERMGDTPVTPQGVRPLFTKEPIRKRGYHRAIKRGEIWALMRQSTVRMCNELTKKMLEPNPLLNLKWIESAKMVGISCIVPDKDPAA